MLKILLKLENLKSNLSFNTSWIKHYLFIKILGAQLQILRASSPKEHLTLQEERLSLRVAIWAYSSNIEHNKNKEKNQVKSLRRVSPLSNCLLLPHLWNSVHVWVFVRTSTNFAHLASFQAIQFVDRPVPKRWTFLYVRQVETKLSLQNAAFCNRCSRKNENTI